jgi:hypothetical protein
MDGTERRLVSIRRRVPTARLEEYLTLWLQLRGAAQIQGAHAWNFVSADVPEVYLEFLEFGAESDIRQDPEVLAAIKALHEGFGDVYPAPQTLEEWVEIRFSAAEQPRE